MCALSIRSLDPSGQRVKTPSKSFNSKACGFALEVQGHKAYSRSEAISTLPVIKNSLLYP